MSAGDPFGVAADAYDRHVGRYADALAQALLEFAAPPAGGSVLDVGCGPGALTAALVERGHAEVAAVDPSEPFVVACRQRVPAAEVRLAPAERMPFGGGAFDAVLSQLVVNFLEDANGGLAEMRRVARPGAVVATAVWDYAEGMTLLRAFWDAAREIDPERGRAADEALTMPHSRPAELQGLWRSAGLADVEIAAARVSARYEDFASLWAPFEAGVGPSGAYAAALDPAPRAALRAALRHRLGSPEGPFALGARAWMARGREPGK